MITGAGLRRKTARGIHIEINSNKLEIGQKRVYNGSILP